MAQIATGIRSGGPAVCETGATFVREGVTQCTDVENRNMRKKHPGAQIGSSPAMTVREAADYLHSARAHVFSLIHSGVLPFQKMGKHFVVPREAVERLLRRGWTQNGKSKIGESNHRPLKI